MDGNYPSTRENLGWLGRVAMLLQGGRGRERPGRLWGRRRPHLQCCVQKECLTPLNGGREEKKRGEGEAEGRQKGGEQSWEGEGRKVGVREHKRS